MTPCSICGRFFCTCDQPATSTGPSPREAADAPMEAPLKIRSSAETSQITSAPQAVGWTLLATSTLSTQSSGTDSVTEAPAAQTSSTQQASQLAASETLPLPVLKLDSASQAVVAEVPPVPPVPPMAVAEPARTAEAVPAKPPAAQAAAQPAPGPKAVDGVSQQQPSNLSANAAPAPLPSANSFHSFSEWAAATSCFEHSRSQRTAIASRLAMLVVVIVIACAVVGYMFGLLPVPPDTSSHTPPQTTAAPAHTAAPGHSHHKPHAAAADPGSASKSGK